ncbi:MAG TPA: TPM domain-containing protein [Candidatus Methylomirabilis sp.]|nr:TPM domain-containing protein [Candidatus Methylomirabilis sp.]
MGLLAALRRRRFLTAAERAQITAALAGVDRYTRARIGLFIDADACDDPEKQAEAMLRQWDLPEAERATAVLLYVSAVSRTFAVMGGEEVRRIAPRTFWEIVHRDLCHHFEERRFCDGIFKALAQVAVQLQHHYPPETHPECEGPSDASPDRPAKAEPTD